ncbi:uncharacterized protein LTR77_007095 [Saxophila tyrrhenica]|uniref:Wings apart-like protein C-terminal domain-containing protein n=1 Tax=Saxophila tyrrhenica TaxID=1690608 RepID=A0AAV9P3R2_9PEZI|nr:hypothetical protein LTR77_007095 [Saxophila tyrrhenica]
MATTSTLQAPKRKKLVYGKLSKPGYSASNFFDDEDELTTSKPTIGSRATVKESYTVQKTEAKAHPVKPPKQPAKQRDPFDIPSSEDEAAEVPSVAPPKYKPALVDDRQRGHYASWERKETNGAQRNGNGRVGKAGKPASPDAQLRRELAGATKSPEANANTARSAESVSPAASKASAVSPSSDTAGRKATSAAARLAARKRLAENNGSQSAEESSHLGLSVPKRGGYTVKSSEETPRKRARTESAGRADDNDIAMDDAPVSPPTELNAVSEKNADVAESNVYDFPDSSEDERVSAKPAVPRQSAKTNARRGKLTRYSRTTPRKGLSAPGRLAEMIATDTDTTEAPTRSPSVPSRNSTPHQPSTPPSAGPGSPEAARRAVTAVTPKQANLWNSLLPSDPIAPSPSALAIKDLSISGSRRTSRKPSSPRLTKSQSDAPRSRTRLVDRLKASVMDSESDLSEDSEDEIEVADSEMTDQPSVSKLPKAAQPPKIQRQTSYSQSQSQTAVTGPKITYSSMRSYLPEDNMEADLMLGLDDEPPPPAAATKRTISSQTQKSAFDFDDSEDDEGPGKMRSIHELRASGSNARGMGDIDDLLDDIAKHSVAQRGMRRTAITSLAARLMDKSFKSRFVGQSCESRLAAECGACPDAIADFLLASCVALLLDTNSPEHVVRSFQDAEIVVWLTMRLSSETPMAKLAKDRKNNMSKSAQTSLLEFSERLRTHTALWHENVPAIVTPRLVSLRALDLLVRALRRIGDRSELLGEKQLQTILPDSSDAKDQAYHLELALAVSVLESLSTAAVTLEWPTEVVEEISKILPTLNATSTMLRDTRFLALRLCLNLTNENARNCELLSKSDNGSTTTYLLQSIQKGFGNLGHEEDAQKKSIVLDFLVLALGIMINLSEHSNEARTQAISEPELLDSLLSIFQFGQRHMLEAESEEESIANVTFGYLAVMLANLCQSKDARIFIASKLPGQNLRMLVDAVEEFVAHHQKVDTLNFEGEEGKEVWGAFTAKLKVVLGRLKEVEAGG